MPADYHIDLQRRRVISRGWGALTFEDCLGHMRRLSGDPAFDPTFSQLMDFREVTLVQMSHSDVYELATRSLFSPVSRRAFITRAAVQFGMARVFQQYRTAMGEFGIRVFEDYDEAVKWLDADAVQGRTAETPAPLSRPKGA